MILLAAVLLFCAVLTVPGGSAQTGDDAARADKAKKEYFKDEDLKVEKIPGKWRLATSVDVQQAQDYSVPVIVTRMLTVYGQRQYLGRIKMPELIIENRSQKVLESVRLRWTIANYDEDHETILLEGVTSSVRVRIEPFNPPVPLENYDPIYFNKIVKPLLKDGELNFHVLLRVGIQEVRFADGTVWQRNQQAALLKNLPSRTRIDLRPARFEPILFFDIFTWRRPKPQSLVSSPCEEQPRSLASAFLFMPLQVSDPPCRENMICGYDPPTNKNICTPLAGSFCDRNGCDSDGHCNCATGVGPCTTCPDNDGDTFTAARCGGDDCDDNDDSVRPRAPEYCDDGKDNDCDRKTDCADETCQNFCTDFDEDGFSTAQGDCNDNDKAVHPDAPEKCDDTIDNNCNSKINEGCGEPPPPDCLDRDGDGYGVGAECVGDDCDDYNANVHEGCGGGDGGDCALRCAEIGAYCDNAGNCYTPVLVDTSGDGFRLTDAAGGVDFDIDGDGAPNRLGWTAAGSDEAFLALDRDGDGRIGSGRELFGDLTPQPPSPDPNGFLALALFDRPEGGGNGDGRVDAGDAVWPSLVLWRDANHNGISEPGELRAPSAYGVRSFSLDYREARRRDRHGNLFRYRAKVYGAAGGPARWAYDVFLVPAR